MFFFPFLLKSFGDIFHRALSQRIPGRLMKLIEVKALAQSQKQ